MPTAIRVIDNCYTDGDSFNSHTGVIVFVDMFKDENKAWENARRIEEHCKISKGADRGKKQVVPKDYDNHSVMLVLEDGTEYKYHVSWNGYFECLESVTVEPVRLKTGGTIII